MRDIPEQLINFYADNEAAGKKKGASSPAKKRGRPKNSDELDAVSSAIQGKFTSDVFIKGLPEGPDAKPATSTEVIITDEKGEQHSEDLCCLFCDKPIED